MENIAVLAPIPSASETIAIRDTDGVFKSIRTASFRFLITAIYGFLGRKVPEKTKIMNLWVVKTP